MKDHFITYRYVINDGVKLAAFDEVEIEFYVGTFPEEITDTLNNDRRFRTEADRLVYSYSNAFDKSWIIIDISEALEPFVAPYMFKAKFNEFLAAP